ncbi:hypothetical protein POM88_013982 [Heracleum sosnowskyi]|uniref:Uncharacterized protein n=1 Tax=Heracleum sosnowskyi TaxID=360622 RepID=A0AAD8J087_9APIA|nr:hypothetical protein POM88_013982 [Heracleum sosnowskyi]
MTVSDTMAKPRNKQSTRKVSRKDSPHSSDRLNLFGANSIKDGSHMRSSLKRGPLGVIDTRLNKRQKMDPSWGPGNVLHKSTVNGNRSTCGSVKTIASLNMVATRCRSCDSLKCKCSPLNGYAYESSKKLSFERYLGHNCVASKTEHESGLTSKTCKSDPDSDVAVSALDEENNCSGPQPSSLCTTAASADACWTPVYLYFHIR